MHFLELFRFLLSMYFTTSPEHSTGKLLLVNECERKYGRHIEQAWIVLDHWVRCQLIPPDSIDLKFQRENKFDVKLCFTIVLTNVLMLSSIVLASVLAILTFHHITTFGTMSIHSARLQRKMLIALCAQANFLLLKRKNNTR